MKNQVADFIYVCVINNGFSVSDKLGEGGDNGSKQQSMYSTIFPVKIIRRI